MKDGRHKIRKEGKKERKSRKEGRRKEGKRRRE
jgi:hypothetical protein